MAPPRPLDSSWMFTIDVVIGPPQPLGKTEQGARIDFPILGGRFDGPNLSGEVLAGGADYFLMRSDDVGILDARYRLRASDGSVIGIRNRGLWVPDEAGLARVREGGEPLPDELYCRCIPEFDAPPGPHAWLNRIVAVGRVEYPAPDNVRITCFRIL